MGQTALLAIAGGTQILGGIAGAQSELMQGQVEAKAATFNAFLEERAGMQRSAAIRRQARKYKGSQRTAIAKSGVTLQGSALDAIAATAAQAEVDAVNTRREALVNAEMLRRQAKFAKQGAKMRAGATLLSSFGQAAGTFGPMMGGTKAPAAAGTGGTAGA